MSRKIGVTRFPGTNCDQDVFDAIKNIGMEPVWLWHADRFAPTAIDAVVVPGGFSYGDYLRCGALAAKAPVMASVSEFAKAGKPVLGICNGFQILCEAGLLPGALVRNRGRRFVDRWVSLSLTNPSRRFGPESKGVKARLPVAHGEGRFVAPPDEIRRLEDRGLVWWTYDEDINGSSNGIAGVMNDAKNVAGLMPHPERAMAAWMGGSDGRGFFSTLL